MKTILKLAVFGLTVYACVNIAFAWLQYFQFKDGVRQASQTGFSLTAAELHQRVLEIAEQNSIPLAQDGFSVHRDDKTHTLIDGSYTKEISLLPIRAFPWTFTFHTDTMTVAPPNLK